MIRPVALKPLMSEKAYQLSESARTYVFVVPKMANAEQISQAVAKQYGVGIASVRVASAAAKPLRVYRRGRYMNANRASLKKAYVTLKEGENLPIFAADKEKSKKAEGEKK